MEKLPAYIVNKIERANHYARKAEKLNLEVEEWMERMGCEEAFDALVDSREYHSYTVSPDEVLRAVNGA